MELVGFPRLAAEAGAPPPTSPFPSPLVHAEPYLRISCVLIFKLYAKGILFNIRACCVYVCVFLY